MATFNLIHRPIDFSLYIYTNEIPIYLYLILQNIQTTPNPIYEFKIYIKEKTATGCREKRR